MRSRAIAILAALSVLVGLALPGAAAAKPSLQKIQGHSTAQIQLHGTNGYSLSLSVFDRRAEALFEKRTGHGGDELVDYEVRRLIAPGPDLHFRLGSEGEVDLHFVPEKTKEREHRGCEGGPEIVEQGRFEGRIAFRGRHGFTRVDARQADGTVSRTPPWTCRSHNPRPGVGRVGRSSTDEAPSVTVGELALIAGTGDRSRSFHVLRLDKPESTEPFFQSFGAEAVRRERGVDIWSTASVEGPTRSFVSPEPSEPLSAATVSPPAPFSGSAAFQINSSGHAEWSGDLAVELAGIGHVRLTGPDFMAGLCGEETCTATLPKWLRAGRSS